MRLFVTGDTSRDFSRFTPGQFPLGMFLSSEDMVLVVGRFDYPDGDSYKDAANREILRRMRFSLAYIGAADDLSAEEYYFGGRATEMMDRVFCLQQGQTYQFGRQKFLVGRDGMLCNPTTPGKSMYVATRVPPQGGFDEGHEKISLFQKWYFGGLSFDRDMGLFCSMDRFIREV